MGTVTLIRGAVEASSFAAHFKQIIDLNRNFLVSFIVIIVKIVAVQAMYRATTPEPVL